jgi:hypothetical protein
MMGKKKSKIAKKLKNIKNKKHDKIVNDYDKIKSKHLEKLAKKMLDEDEKKQKLKEKKIDDKFLDLF